MIFTFSGHVADKGSALGGGNTSGRVWLGRKEGLGELKPDIWTGPVKCFISSII